jgi:hypothetical protein
MCGPEFCRSAQSISGRLPGVRSVLLAGLIALSTLPLAACADRGEGSASNRTTTTEGQAVRVIDDHRCDPAAAEIADDDYKLTRAEFILGRDGIPTDELICVFTLTSRAPGPDEAIERPYRVGPGDHVAEIVPLAA